MPDGREQRAAKQRPQRAQTIATAMDGNAMTASRAYKDLVRALADGVVKQLSGKPADAGARAQADCAASEEARGSLGMGAFADGEFSGGTGATGEPGYGQDGELRGGYGEGSGYAQSSRMGGYGQGAAQQGGHGESGSDQHNDERFGQLDDRGEQRESPYGYGGQGTHQPGGQELLESSRNRGRSAKQHATGKGRHRPTPSP